MTVDSFGGKLAVVTGGGSGIGRELVRQLAAQGCSVAACDLNPDSVAVTAATAWAAAPPGVAVNMSSVASFWATAGRDTPVSAYSTASFVIRGFSEALIEDLRGNAPQVRVVVAMPGTVSTGIAANSRRVLGLPEWEELSDARLLEELPEAGRAILVGAGLLPEDFSADDLRRLIPRMNSELQDTGFAAAQAAAVILDGVRSGAWRILVGEEAAMLDEQVRANPEAPFNYDGYAEMYGPLIARALAEAPGTPQP